MNTETKPSRNPWPIAIIAYFIVFIAFTAVIITYISSQKMDLVRGDYYDDEIRYQEQLDRMNRTQPFNAQVAIAYNSAQQSITISLPPNHSQSSGRIRLYRPSDETLDQDIKLAVGPDGVQRLNAKKLQAGLWKIRVYWTVDGQDYFFTKAVVVGPKQT
jgi:hypothetical protein